jgi:cell division protein FtsB
MTVDDEQHPVDATNPATGPGDTAWIPNASSATSRQSAKPAHPSRSRLTVVGMIALAAAFVIAATMWVFTLTRLTVERETVQALQAQIDSLEDSGSQLREQVAAHQKADEARQDAEGEVPDLRAVSNTYFTGIAVVTGGAESISITIRDSNVALASVPIQRMLEELGFSSAVIDRMSNTRALDGTQEAEGKNCNVTWTYHPDDGLQMVFEAIQSS